MTDLDPHQDEYRGMRNPYHMAFLLNNTIDLTGDKATKKSKVEVELKNKYKKNNLVGINIFSPKQTKDKQGNILEASPLFPFVEQWWDSVEE